MEDMEEKIKEIAFKLRKIRELKGMSREKFCKPLGENSEYWGMIERGEQNISLLKLLQVCQTYNILIEDIVDLEYETQDDIALRKDIAELLEDCKGRQLEAIKKFVQDIATIL